MGGEGKQPNVGSNEQRPVRSKRLFGHKFWPLVALGCIGAWLVFGGLNYARFCTSKGHILSKEELIRKAVKLELAGRGNVLGGNAIAYNSINAFLNRNPDCCDVSPRELTDSNYNSFWSPLLLHDFQIEVSVHYRAFESGDKPFRQSVFVLDECGRYVEWSGAPENSPMLKHGLEP